jgi:hypothetical protein
LGCKAIAVKPLLAATVSPFVMVSRSSKPGSPSETLLSNQPCETCILSSCISSALSGFGSDVPIFFIKPSTIKISAVLL